MTAPTRTKHTTTKLTERLPERRYLPELHGVRGLALLGVVLFHLFGNGRISGGIDIFLAVSGFLFTGMLLREAANNNGRIDFFKYFGRLVRRIFIPLALVVVVTLIAGLVISPVTQHQQLWAEARASLLYFENFELINSQLAYGAAGPETSPFQHIWSLSVQGQFYLLWPFVAIIAVLIAKATKTKTSAAKIMGILVAVIFVGSFVYAIYVGSYNQDEAYLMTTTRAWELAFGGLLALAGGTLRLPKLFRGIAGWLGVALIALCGVFLDGAALFPGPWALWPLAGFTLVLIAAGPTGGNDDPIGSATHFLSNKPLAWIGDRAYGLYLWHWPTLIYYLELRDREAIGWRGALVILTITVVLAMLTYRYVEQPLQRITNLPRPVRIKINKSAVGIAASFLAIGGLTTTALTPPLDDLRANYEGLDPDVYPGATQAFQDEPAPHADPFPPIEEARSYRPEYIARECQQKAGQNPGTGEITVCEDENKPEHPTATVVLAGGSHAGHLEAAFKTLGAKYGWEVLIVTKSSCVFGLEEHDDERCGEWNHNFIEWLDDNPVDLVVTPSTRLPNSGTGPEYFFDAAPSWWERITATGTELLLVRGMPRQSEDAPDCLADGGTSLECGPSKEGYAETDPLLEIDLPAKAHPVDVTEAACPNINNPEVDNCEAIVGNILVSYDNHHLTTPFSQSLAPAFEEEMQEAVPHFLR